MLELRDPGWTATVDRDPFGEILLSGLAVVAVFLVADHGTTPGWLLLDPGLSAMCFAVAFQRIRQARLVEVASSSAWDEVATVWGRREHRTDEGLEGAIPVVAAPAALRPPVRGRLPAGAAGG